MSIQTALIERFRNTLSSYRGSRDGLPESLLMDREGDLSVYYAPFEHLNPTARVVLVGITPGIQQASNALDSVRAALNSGMSDDEALRIAKAKASFSGAMRGNLIRCLDIIGVPAKLGIPSTDLLFGSRTDLVHYTSVLRYPVLHRGANYNRQVPIRSSSFLQRWVREAFETEVEPLAEALWIPLGDQPAEVLDGLVRKGHLRSSQVLLGVPHPSGANAERVACFCGTKAPEQASTKTNAAKLIEARERLRRQLLAA